VEPPGGEGGNIEHTWGMYNKPTGCSTPAYGAPHKQTKQTYILPRDSQGRLRSNKLQSRAASCELDLSEVRHIKPLARPLNIGDFHENRCTEKQHFTQRQKYIFFYFLRILFDFPTIRNRIYSVTESFVKIGAGKVALYPRTFHI
jgi:hypothetical protein